MKKSWLVSFLIIIGSLFIIGETKKTNNRFEIQEGFDQGISEAIFNNKPVQTSAAFLADVTAPQTVLGESDAPKRIEVDLTNQRVYAYEGDSLIYNFLVSTGKWGRTPTGTFRIWSKYRYIKMSGGSVALRTYYYLPNVPYTMFFSNDKVAASRGYALHGTYWHNNFGHPMSHGCINMKTSEAGIIYEWSSPKVNQKNSIVASKDNPGAEIVIYGEAPKN